MGASVTQSAGTVTSLRGEVGEVAVCADLASHDPYGIAGAADVFAEEQFAEVLEAREDA